MSSSIRKIRARIRTSRFGVRILFALIATCLLLGVGFLFGAQAVSVSTDKEFYRLQQEVRVLQSERSRVGEKERSLQVLIEELLNRDSDNHPALTQSAPDGTGIGGGRESETPDIISVFRKRRSLVQRLSPSRKLSDAMRLDRWVNVLQILPLGSPVSADVNSGFGYRISPQTGHSHFHSGLDFAVESSSRVESTGEGRVIEAGYKGSYGLSVVIDHGQGIHSLYAHLSSIRVRVGEQVCRGKELGLVGSTGNSTGPHLHYEIRIWDRPWNPLTFVEFPELTKALL